MRHKLAKREQKTKGKKAYKVDFGGVEGEPGRRKRPRIKEGDYLCKIVSVERKKNKAGDAYYFSWKFQVIEDSRGNKKAAGTPLYYNTSLKPAALFNLRNLIFAASDGKTNVTGKALNFDPNKLVGKKIGVVVEDDEYEGKMRSSAEDIMPVSAMVSEEDSDDEEDDSEDEEDSEDEDEEDDSEDEEEEDSEDDSEDSDDSDDSDDLEDVDV